MIKPIIKVKHCHRADDMDDNFLTEKIVLPVLRNPLPHNHRVCVWQEFFSSNPDEEVGHPAPDSVLLTVKATEK
jgi:hypothetical protein